MTSNCCHSADVRFTRASTASASASGSAGSTACGHSTPWSRLEHPVQRPHAVAEAVDEAAGGALEVAHLHQGAGEVEAGHVGRLPLGRQGREPVVDHQLRAAVAVEDRGVEPEPGADDHAVVAQVARDLVGAREADGDEVAAVAALDPLDGPVEQRVLGLELVGVEQVVVDRPQVPDVVRSPGHPQRRRARDVDDRRRLDQVVGGLEPGVALADDQHALVEEVARVDGDLAVALRRLDAGDRRDVGRVTPVATITRRARWVPAVLVGDHEAAVRARHRADARAVDDPQPQGGGVVREIAHQVVGVGEVALRVAREEQARVVRQQRVPVHPQVELRVVPAGVRLVDGDQPPVARERAEEAAGSGSGLEDRVVPARLLEVVAELEPRRAGADDEVLGVGHRASKALRIPLR